MRQYFKTSQFKKLIKFEENDELFCFNTGFTGLKL